MQDAIANASFLYLICQITSETVQKNSGNKNKTILNAFIMHIHINQMHPTESVSFRVNLVHFMNFKSFKGFQNKEPLGKCITGVLIEHNENLKHLKVI